MGSKNLNEKIMECISNPAKSRLLIEIMRRGKLPRSIWLKNARIFLKLRFIAI